jgi:predicted transcriptional regulator
MSDYKKHLEEQLNDPAFATEWERQRPEREYIKAIIAARLETNMTQKDLAAATGIRQSNISRIENGNCSPTVATLQQIADGVGKTLHIEFR